MKDAQRKGQKLINWVRFVKNRKESVPPSDCERYIFNMSDTEFEEAMNKEWPEITEEMMEKRVKKIVEMLDTTPEEHWGKKVLDLGQEEYEELEKNK